MQSAKRQRTGLKHELKHEFVGSDEISHFAAVNSLDERAVRELLSESPQVQRMVVDKGDLAACNNPSAAVLGRIRDAKREVATGRDKIATDPSSAPAEINSFIVQNHLDDRAGRELRAAEPQIQLFVLNQGLDLSQCQNPSSVVIGRIRDAKRGGAVSGMLNGGGLNNSMNMGMGALQRQGAILGVGGRGGALGSLPSRVASQRKMSADAKGDLFSVLQKKMGRSVSRQDVTFSFIQHQGLYQATVALVCTGGAEFIGAPADSKKQAEHNASGEALKEIGHAPSQNTVPGMMPVGRIQSSAQHAPQGLGQGDVKADLVAMLQFKCGRVIGGTDVIYSIRQQEGVFQASVRLHCWQGLEFAGELSNNALDAEQHAAHQAFQEFSKDVPAFMQANRRSGGMGGLTPLVGGMGAVGLYAGVAGRGSLGGSIMVRPPTAQEVETFLAHNNVDERGAREFRNEGPSIQRNVLDKGMDLSNCTNPSSAVIGRIREAKREIQQGTSTSRAFAPEEVENFINSNGLDERAAQELRNEGPSIQMSVLDKGLDLSLTRNPGSVVIGRIREAKRELSQGTLHVMPQTSPMEVDQFLVSNQIDERAANDLRKEPPEIQLNVLNKGLDLSNCQNPSSVVIGRIRDAKKEIGAVGLRASRRP